MAVIYELYIIERFFFLPSCVWMALLLRAQSSNYRDLRLAPLQGTISWKDQIDICGQSN